MPFTTILPPPDEGVLQSLTRREPVLLRVSADLDFDQRFNRVHVALTASRVLVVADGRILQCHALAGLTTARADELYGSGRLVVIGPAGERTLCYFTRNLVPEFTAAARAITELILGRTPSLPEMSESCSCERCQAPLAERGANCPLCVPRGRIFLRILGLMRPHRRQVVLLMLGTFVGVAMQMLPPLAYREITDHVIGQKHLQELPLWIGLILGAFVVSSACRLLSQGIAIRISGRVVTDLQSRLHEHLSRLRLSYHNRREAGEMVGRVMNDTGELQGFLTNGIPYLLVNAVMLLAIAVILVALDPLLALMAFLPVPVLMLGGAWFWKRLIPMFHNRDSRRGRIYSLLGESLRGIKVVKSLNQEGRRALEFSAANEQALAAHALTERTNFVFFEVLALVMQFGTILVWFVGARGVVTSLGRHPSLGDLMAFAGYMAMFYGPLQWFAAVLNWMTGAFAGAQRIFQVLDQATEEVPIAMVASVAAAAPATPGAEPQPIRGEVTFRNVCFSYERGKEVLRDINLSVPAGTMLGLVGRSGSGKSTIIGLLCRFHEPDHGEILIDGVALSSLPLDGYRSAIGIVMQDPFLFRGSIIDNIRYGRPGADFSAVVAAAKAAHCHDVILQKEDGYDTVVGEGGVELSGGEKQRLSIARAIVSDPRILILDEATSAVDSETEQAIQESIGRLVQGRTTIAIAHRLATLRNAHRLAVIEDGRVVEQGTHDELMAKEHGHFATMVRLQGELNRLTAEQIVEIACTPAI